MNLAEILNELEAELKILSAKLTKISESIQVIKIFCKENGITDLNALKDINVKDKCSVSVNREYQGTFQTTKNKKGRG